MRVTNLRSPGDPAAAPFNPPPLSLVWQAPSWLLLRPSAWRNYLNHADPTLTTRFCLAQLTPAQWRNPALQQLLLIGYAVWPGLIALGLAAVVWLSGWLDPLALFGWALGVSLGLMLGTVISVGVGISVAVGLSAVLGIAWGTPQLITADLMTGVRFALGFGLTGALTIYGTGTLTQTVFNAGLTRQAGSFVLGFLVSLILAAAFVAALVTLMQANQANLVTGPALGLIFSGVLGMVLGVAVGWRIHSWRRGTGIGCLLAGFIAILYGNLGAGFEKNPGGQELLASYSVVATFLYITLLILPYVLVERIAGAWAGAVAGAIASLSIHLIIGNLIAFYAVWPNVALGIGLAGLGITMPWWRPLLFYPFEAAWNTVLLRLDQEYPNRQSPYLGWHAAFWDELQTLPLYGLDEHLVLILERNPSAGQIALDAISSSRQRWAAQAAQIELDARRLERYQSPQEIANAHAQLAAGELEGPASALLRSFSRLSKDVAAALGQISTYNQRLVLMAVEDALNGLLRELTRSSEPYAGRFRPVAHQWRQIIASYIQTLAEQAESRQEIQNPYIVGVPLSRQQEVFVGRTAISARIEQILQEHDQPPLLLYGQRRMGKTSLLRHLRWLLPNRIVPLFIDLQGPVALSSNHSSFLYNIAKAISTSAQEQGLALPLLTRAALADDPFTLFDDWLDQVESALVSQGRSTILLTLDEFEALDSALTSGRFSEEAILGGLRHIIQHRPRFKLLLAGSHTLDEFQRWSSYLINAQVLHLSYLHTDEARQLIERPMQNFALTYEAAASQHVLDVTRGHPYLVQLLCSELVARKNEQAQHLRRRATQPDVEAAVPAILVRGSQFFADIQLHQVDAHGLALLRFLAQQANEPVDLARLTNEFAIAMPLEQTIDRLQRREIIEAVHGSYRFQVELIRRWFAKL